MKEMKRVQNLTMSILGLALATFVSACGTTTKETTTYVPTAPPAQVVVQAPVEVPAPAPPTTTTSTSSDRTSNSSNSSPNTGTDYSSSSHHSESTITAPSN